MTNHRQNNLDRAAQLRTQSDEQLAHAERLVDWASDLTGEMRQTVLDGATAAIDEAVRLRELARTFDLAAELL